MGAVTPIAVLVVDDHAIVRHGIRTFFETQPDLHVAGEVASAGEALAVAAALRPDVVLMDLVLGGLDGVEATARLRASVPGSRIVVLTAFSQDELVFPALRAGASGYLLKDVHPRELADAVRRVARGETVIAPAIAARLVRGLTPGPFASLTVREREVLRLLARGEGNAAIAARLSISERTVKKHVSNILGKLQVADRTNAAVRAWEEGLVGRDRVSG
jgi:NarL family two-component system response regulator LiaR